MILWASDTVLRIIAIIFAHNFTQKLQKQRMSWIVVYPSTDDINKRIANNFCLFPWIIAIFLLWSWIEACSRDTTQSFPPPRSIIIIHPPTQSSQCPLEEEEEATLNCIIKEMFLHSFGWLFWQLRLCPRFSVETTTESKDAFKVFYNLKFIQSLCKSVWNPMLEDTRTTQRLF